MASSLTAEQREFVERQARCHGRAVALLGLLQGADTVEALEALFAAATSMIASSYGPGERCKVLNHMLADTINEWSAAVQ